jgi:hypothetical protein
MILHRFRWPRGLRRGSSPLGYCYRGFESRSGYGCSSLCLYVVLSCVDRGLCDELLISPKEFYNVYNNIIEISKRRPWPDPSWSAIGRKLRYCNVSRIAVKSVNTGLSCDVS